MNLPHSLSRIELEARFLGPFEGLFGVLLAVLTVLASSAYLSSSAAPRVERALSNLGTQIVLVVAGGSR